MKINEILHEGILDYAKGLLKTGSLTGASAASAQAQGQKELQQFANAAFQKWNQYTGSTGDTNVVGWATKFFNGNVSDITAPKDASANTVKKYITDVAKAYKAGQLPSLTSREKKAAAIDQRQQVQQTSTGDSASMVGRYRKKTPPTQTSQQSQVYQSPLDITIRQFTDPVIVDYKGKPFMLNDRGEWALDGRNTAGAQASEPIQTEIDKVLRANNLL